jgi:triacylglycerol lipase
LFYNENEKQIQAKFSYYAYPLHNGWEDVMTIDKVSLGSNKKKGINFRRFKVFLCSIIVLSLLSFLLIHIFNEVIPRTSQDNTEHQQTDNIYSADEAYRSASLCQFSYFNEEDLKEKLNKYGYKTSSFLKDKRNNIVGCILVKNKTILVVFRGTKTLRDTITDSKFLLKPAPDSIRGKIHSGFKSRYVQDKKTVFQIIDNVYDKLTQENKSKPKMYFAGHSLGGAIAQLMALGYSLHNNSCNINGIYLYGCPRIGNAEYVEYYNSHLGNYTYQHVNEGDPVSKIPSKCLRYRHSGKWRIIIPSDEKCDSVLIEEIVLNECDILNENSILNKEDLLTHEEAIEEIDLSLISRGYNIKKLGNKWIRPSKHKIFLYRSLLAIESADQKFRSN